MSTPPEKPTPAQKTSTSGNTRTHKKSAVSKGTGRWTSLKKRFFTKKKKRRRRWSKKERRSLLRTTGAVLVTIGIAAASVYGLYFLEQSRETASRSPSLTTPLKTFEQAVLLREWLRDPSEDHVVYLSIAEGDSVAEVCSRIEKFGILAAGETGEMLLRYLVRNELDTLMRAGGYLFPERLGIRETAAVLERGYGEFAVLKFYPGITLDRIDRYLTAMNICEREDFIAASRREASRRGLPFAEGFLYPGEYVLRTDHLAARALAAGMMEAALGSSSLFSADIERKGRTLDEVIRVASMIQRETSRVDQMGLIAGIIWNRLERGMPLGIDATTRYETDNWTRPITREELRADTPFNTRMKPGLPPTGIGNPGIAAIAAAVYPHESDYLYYLHDKEGNMHPSPTYEGHLEYVEQYLR